MERKVKYDFVFMPECVKLMLDKHYSCNYVFNQKDTNKSNIRNGMDYKQQYELKITKSAIDLKDDELHIGYLKLNKIPK